jgi:hypothetical protein
MSDVKIASAVYVICERCGAQSKAMTPEAAEKWSEQHDSFHVREERHRITLVTEWMDPDDSSGHAKCLCGWRSRSAKVCWTSDFADAHLEDVEAADR